MTFTDPQFHEILELIKYVAGGIGGLFVLWLLLRG